MKKVGIILRDYTSKTNNPIFAIREDLIYYLQNYNIELICIPVCFKNNQEIEFRRVEKIINECQGIILPGGENYYDIDLKIVKYLYKHNIPTLGICLGMQIMALNFNGQINTLPNQNHQKKEKYVHQIKIKEDSLLYQILETNSILVNSRHSEYIVNTNLNIVAISNDFVIEAIEDPTKSFFVGVQWHPESLFTDIYSKKIFDYFIQKL